MSTTFQEFIDRVQSALDNVNLLKTNVENIPYTELNSVASEAENMERQAENIGEELYELLEEMQAWDGNPEEDEDDVTTFLKIKDDEDQIKGIGIKEIKDGVEALYRYNENFKGFLVAFLTENPELILESPEIKKVLVSTIIEKLI